MIIDGLQCGYFTRDVFEQLYQYKVDNGIPTWEQVLEKILPVEEQVKR